MRNGLNTGNPRLPAGADNDPNAPYNATDHSHEHLWIDEHGPMFEDGAAIFHEKCDYVEGRHSEGWSCEETRKIRFEATELHVGGSPAHELPDVTKEPEGDYERCLFGLFDDVMNAAVNGDGELAVCNPDPDSGEVVYQFDDIEVTFEPK
jgi:hypothetical protein